MVWMGLEVLRDAKFGMLGILCHKQDQMLVMFYDEAYLDQLVANPSISAVITTPALAERLPNRLGIGICSDPMQVFYRIHDHLRKNTDFYGKAFVTEIDATATVSEQAFVAPRNVRIGARCVIEPKAIILEGSVLDEDVVIRAGTVIGGEGYETKMVGGQLINVRHAGGVHLAHRVEVLSQSHLARSIFGGWTEVGEETKIDVQVHVSHHDRIGRQCEIAAGAVIGGSTTVGDRAWIGLNAAISSGLTIGSGAFIVMGSVVAMNVPPGARVMGNPARIMKVS